ncbi:MAG: ribbon-helix-helix protein, CopG family [Candidatus Xenobia bacterium]
MITSVRRTQLQLDDRTYHEIRRRAFESGQSMAEVIRSLLQEALRQPPDGEADEQWRRALSVVGGFRDKDAASDVSTRHDDYLKDIDPS